MKNISYGSGAAPQVSSTCSLVKLGALLVESDVALSPVARCGERLWHFIEEHLVTQHMAEELDSILQELGICPPRAPMPPRWDARPEL